MKNIIAIVFLCFGITSVLAQHKEERRIKLFNGISTATNLDVVYVLSDKNEIVVDCEKKEHLNLILTEVKNNVLTIRYKPNSSIRTHKPNKVIVYANSKLNSIKVSSGSNLNIQSEVESPKLKIETTSSGKLNVKNIQANLVELNVSSSADVVAAIIANKINLKASSSGKLSLSGKINAANIDMNSSAKLDLTKCILKDVICVGNSSAKLNLYKL